MAFDIGKGRGWGPYTFGEPMSGVLSRVCVGPKWSSMGSAQFWKHLRTAFPILSN